MGFYKTILQTMVLCPTHAFGLVAGVYSVTTVTRVSVKAGDSVSIPCLYHPKYTSHVKYLCQGYSFISCSCAVKTNQQSSGRFLISDDREKKVFTVTIKDVREGDTDFWCVVEINEGSDDGTYFQVSVTRGKKQTLYVDHQEVTGFIGGQTTIKCYYQNSGQAKWCRVGGPCVTPSQGSINGTTVFINETLPRVFTVTMSGLKMEDSGWYWCSRGDLQMPVQIIVREKPSTSNFDHPRCSFTRLRSTTQTTGVPCKGESSSSSSFLCQLRSSAARSPLLLVQTEWVSKQDLVTHCLLTSSQTSLILTNRIHVGAGLGCQQLQHLYETPSCSSFLINIPQTIKIYIQ
uniref:Immunoglobulin domain-containing protein n=1 Tax=Takifugu rubripes TaxID=31033 RepID=A0A674NG34_TAKRU